MHKSQTLFYFLISFIVGIFISSLLTASYEIILALLMVGIGALAVFGYQRSYSRKGIFGSMFFLMVVLGMARFSYSDLSNSTLLQFADRYAGNKPVPITVVGYVDEEPGIGAKTTQFNFRVKKIVLQDKILELNEKTRVVASGAVYKKTGDILEIFGAVSTPTEFDEEFDYVNYLKKDGIKTLVLFPEIKETGGLDTGFYEKARINFKRKVFAVKSAFENSINRSVMEPNASYINGILLGSRQNIPDDLKEDFNKTGTTHILAISGYNIMIIASSLLAGLVFFVRRRTAFWISVAVIAVFTVMTGSSASVVRASLMGLLLLYAQGYGRMYDVRNSIVLAGAVMVFINPAVLVFDIGFQLSFLAVLGLIYLYPFLKNKLEKFPDLFGFKEAFLATASAQAFVVLPLLFYFKQFSLVSLPANILILPFTPLAMLAGFFTGLAGFISPHFGQFFGFIAWAITTYQIAVIEFFAGLV
ncbi:MAG: ComEC/Rec2 family competence protein [Candidatus Paceibacterota bacterium]